MGCTYKRGTTWWIKYFRNGRANFESSNSNRKEDATTLLKLKEGDVARGVPVTAKIGQLRFDKARDDLLNYQRANRRPTKKLEARIANHLTPVFGGRRMTSITPLDARAYVVSRQTAGASNATINRELTILKRMFSLAIKAGLLYHKPYIELLRENNARSGFFEAAQFESMRRVLPEAIRPVVMFAYVTGWRITSEVLPLQWRQVDLQAGTVRLDPGSTKNGEGRVFHITDELRTLLEERQRLADELKQKGVITPWVFFRMVAKGRRGLKSPKRITAFGKAWKTACRKAGCPGRIPHDLRRTAVRNMVRAGIPERVAMQLTGHKTRSVFERYNIVSESDLTDAAQRLSKHLSIGQ